MQKTNVGSIEVFALVDNVQHYPATAIYPKADLAPYGGYLDAEGRVAMNFGCFLVRDGATTLLVDTGWGPEYNGRLLAELAETGTKPGDVTHVMFTHLHGDHTGWNLDRATGRPIFSAAKYLVPQKDWDHYSATEAVPPAKSNSSFVRDVVPLEQLGIMQLIEGEHTITPGLTAIPTPGHTPGHTSVVITAGDERGFILGDVVISAIDAEEPTVASVYDWDSGIALETRRATVERLIADGSLVGASHLPSPGLGRFVREGTRQYWQAI